jgi:hypothetical protein
MTIDRSLLFTATMRKQVFLGEEKKLIAQRAAASFF